MKYEFVYSQPNGASNWIPTEGHPAPWGHHQFHVTRTDVTVLHTPFFLLEGFFFFFVRAQFGGWKDMRHCFNYCTASLRSYKATMLAVLLIQDDWRLVLTEALQQSEIP